MLTSHFRLVDINPNYFNCGHYPQFEVRQVDRPLPEPPPRPSDYFPRTSLVYEDRARAEAAAARMNAASSAAWRSFLDG